MVEIVAAVRISLARLDEGHKGLGGGVFRLPAGGLLELVAEAEDRVPAEADPAAAGREQAQLEGGAREWPQDGCGKREYDGARGAKAPLGRNGIVCSDVVDAGDVLLVGEVEGLAEILFVDHLVVGRATSGQSGELSGPQPREHVVDPGADQERRPQDGECGSGMVLEEVHGEVFDLDLARVVVIAVLARYGELLREADRIVRARAIDGHAAGVDDLSDVVADAGGEDVPRAVDVDVAGRLLVLDLADDEREVIEDVHAGEQISELVAADVFFVKGDLFETTPPRRHVDADDALDLGIGLELWEHSRGEIAVYTGDCDCLAHCWISWWGAPAGEGTGWGAAPDADSNGCPGAGASRHGPPAGAGTRALAAQQVTASIRERLWPWDPASDKFPRRDPVRKGNPSHAA